MFDFVHKHKTLIQIVLAIVFLPFAFFGVDSYFRGSDRSGEVGEVNGRPITQQEYAQSLQERQAALQRMIGGSVPPGLLDSPEIRNAVVDGIVRQRLLIDRSSLVALPSSLRAADWPAFPLGAVVALRAFPLGAGSDSW